MGSTQATTDNPILERTSGQVRMLLMLAGDVEINPGPLNTDTLVTGLSDLVEQAPSSMRDVLCAWSPDRPSNMILEELTSRKFTVGLLQPALAWLLNKDESDPVVKSVKKKYDIAQAIVLGIERLLPEICGDCGDIYVVQREEAPGLECKGCGQGFHQACLAKKCGGMSSLPQLSGTLHWLCNSCSPYFDLTTKVGQGGRSKPARKTILPSKSRSTPEPATITTNANSDTERAGIYTPVPSAQVRIGLPYLWGQEIG